MEPTEPKDSCANWTASHCIIEDVRKNAASADLIEAIAAKIDAQPVDARRGDDHRPPSMTALPMLSKLGSEDTDQHKSEALRILIERGASVTACDSSNARPLDLAAGSGCVWALPQLLAHSPNHLNVPNARNQFPLDCIGPPKKKQTGRAFRPIHARLS